ncbi:MAG: amidase, partial [Gemmatimonadales bacterium]
PWSGRSPWGPALWSGVSSGVSGAAVGAGLVPFAIGSETWGSIQFPAAFCGVSGLRPTYGRVSRHGAMALSWTMDKLGPLGRTAEDCGRVLGAMAGPDAADQSALAQRFHYPPRVRPPSRFRLGVLRGTLDKTQPEVRRNFEASLAVLSEFAEVEEDLELPDFPYEAMASVIIDAEAASAFEPLFQSGRITELTAPEDRIGGYSGQVVLAKDYLRALRLRRPAAAALDGLLGRVDALVAPSLPTVAWPIDAPFDKVYPDFPGGTSISGAANLCGAPGLFMMNGTGEGGLPTSLQLTGRALGEGTLLAIGARYQQRTDHHHRRPPGL